MLDAKEVRRRIIEAMDTATPRVTPAAVARACKITPQAVNGWRKTGRVSKGHLLTLATMTKRNPAYFLGDDAAAAVPTPEELKPREEIMLLLFRGLFSLQQSDQITKMRALFQSNQVTRKEMGLTVTRG